MTSLKAHIQSLLQTAFATVTQINEPVVITRATQAKFGHFQCNSAMPLAKKVGKNPRELAESVIKALKESDASAFFSKIEIAGPGFINLSLSPTGLSALARAQNGILVHKKENPSRVVLDFSSPNVAKEMHVGHLRSTIIGDSLARILSYLGDEVIRLNHVGDWGTAFGMLIAYLKAEEPGILSGDATATLQDLMGWYRASKARFDEDEAFKTTAREQVVALQAGDKDALVAWRMICDVSYIAYSEVYARLDVTLTIRGESFYNEWLPRVVKDLAASGVLEESNGAKCVFLPGFKNKTGDPLPMIVQKSDGGYNYTTTDLATLRHRVHEEKADRIIYVTDAGQRLHFDMLFECAKRTGLVDEARTELCHVPFGLVLGETGKKIKTRSGHAERLIDLLDVAAARATAIFVERHPDWSSDQCTEAGDILGIAAVKYADLSNHRQSDYQFSYDKMLAFEGNTAAFSLYAYVRCQSIRRKLSDRKAADIAVTEPAEVNLLIHLMLFSDCLERVAIDLTPHYLTDYLHQTAVLFNAFFRDCRVEGVPEEASRLALVEWTASALSTALQLLGMRTLERM